MKRCRALLSSLALALVSTPAAAFPGFFAYKGAKPNNLSTHVILMKKDATTVVTVMPDYQGDLKPFAVMMPVPDDVKAEDVKGLKRDFVERIDQITAPRFWEFWEMDPCDPAGQQQEWERDLSVHGGGFLGTDMNFAGDQPSAFKPGKEMALTVEPDFKEGENVPSIVSAADAADIEGWLKTKGYSAPEGTNAAAAQYAKAGMNFLMVEVDTKKIELLGGDRAVVSPIRYSTQKPVTIASTLGLLNLGTMQEIFVYIIHPEQRFEVKNYPNVFPPTNVEVDFKVKERMGEFYAGLHDLLLTKQPLGFLNEFAWNAKGCGQPCPGEPLLIHELLSLGGDVFEASVPKEERLPKPPDLTEEEEKQFKEIKEKQKKKEIEEMRKETARRKALLSRHHYILSRVHHRYDRKTLPKDIEVGPADAIHGGVDVPKGEKAELPTDVKPAAENEFQVRYTSFHQSPAIPHCDKPERWRWGKAPRTYLGLRKIWVAQDMATKNRTSHKPAELVYTPLPNLQIAGHLDLAAGIAEAKSFGPAPSASAPVEGGSDAKKSGCGCRVAESSGSAELLALPLALGALATRRRRRAREIISSARPASSHPDSSAPRNTL
jgi:MYXO-CTERM domain-containing protein